MSNLKINLNISDLTKYLEKFAQDIAKDVEQGIKGLAKSTHTHIMEETSKKLDKWDRQKYLDNLSQAEQINDFLWVITLNEPAKGIEEGRPAWDMKGEPGKWGLLKNPDGKTKDGREYKIIPMEQGKESNSFSPEKLAQNKEMVSTLKTFLKSKGVPLRKLEVDSKTGSPRLGKLHSFNIPSAIPGKGNTPQLSGLNIYQVKNEKTGKVARMMTTFRTAVKGDGKWMHKAIDSKNLFQEAADWANSEWDKEWLPKIIMKYKE